MEETMCKGCKHGSIVYRSAVKTKIHGEKPTLEAQHASFIGSTLLGSAARTGLFRKGNSSDYSFQTAP